MAMADAVRDVEIRNSEIQPLPGESVGKANDDEITLGVLATVHADANVTQRHMAIEVGVALGLANAYLKRCVRKGFIKVQQAPRRRYTYYLTPQGFAEKARLTGEYLSSSLQFFRRSREQISGLLETCAGNGWKRVALLGVSELAEISTLCAHDVEVTLVGIVDPNAGRTQFSGLPIVARLDDLMPVDAVIVTAMHHADGMIGKCCAAMPPERILAPRVLRLTLASAAVSKNRTAESSLS